MVSSTSRSSGGAFWFVRHAFRLEGEIPLAPLATGQSAAPHGQRRPTAMSTNVAKPLKVAILGASGTYGKAIFARAEEVGVEAVVVTRSSLLP